MIKYRIIKNKETERVIIYTSGILERCIPYMAEDTLLFRIETIQDNSHQTYIRWEDAIYCVLNDMDVPTAFSDESPNIGFNIGAFNNGSCNMGVSNTGYNNQGNNNQGDNNIGDSNFGHKNIGDGNYGSYNHGDCNIGNKNIGNCNRGDDIMGYFNVSSDAIGVLCTKPSKLKFFNKESNMTLSEWRNSEIALLLEEIDSQETFAEKCILYTENYDKIKNIPNFNKEMFEDITGWRIN